jgi:hypothetical protein
MERMIAALTILALPLVSTAQDGKKKEAPAGEAGPFLLPTLASVKEKCKATEAQAPKLDTIYADAAKSEVDIRRRAKESESDRKTTEKFLADGKLEVVLKIKEVLVGDQKKTFDDLAAAAGAQPAKKKK